MAFLLVACTARHQGVRAPTSLPEVVTTDPARATSVPPPAPAPAVTVPASTVAPTTTTTTIPPPTCALSIDQGAASLRSDQRNATYWAHVHPDSPPGKDVHTSGTTNAAGGATIQVKPPGDRPPRTLYDLDVNFGAQPDDQHPVCSVQFLY